MKPQTFIVDQEQYDNRYREGFANGIYVGMLMTLVGGLGMYFLLLIQSALLRIGS